MNPQGDLFLGASLGFMFGPAIVSIIEGTLMQPNPGVIVPLILLPIMARLAGKRYPWFIGLLYVALWHLLWLT